MLKEAAGATTQSMLALGGLLLVGDHAREMDIYERSCELVVMVFTSELV